MIELAEEEERTSPLGCRYLHRDAATLEQPDQVDLVVAVYLLNYARTREELLRFVEAAHALLRPGGRFVGFNDNVRNVPRGRLSLDRYGLEKECAFREAGFAGFQWAGPYLHPSQRHDPFWDAFKAKP